MSGAVRYHAAMLRPTGAATTVAAILMGGALAAQQDLRDLVTTKAGKEVRGRVANPFAPGPLLVVQGGKRVRVERDEVASMQLVADSVREFLERRVKLRGNARGQEILVEWADSRQLPNLAQAQAMRLCLQGEAEAAHRRLGHRRRGDHWLWPVGDRWIEQRRLDETLRQKPMLLLGERFAVRTDGALDAALDALFDLERLGVHWLDEFGPGLQLDEALEPCVVEIRAAAADFQKWGFRPIPYYEPSPFGDLGRTFLAKSTSTRPELLFLVGSQAFLYRTLIGDLNARDDRDRVCAWLEIGLPMLAEHAMRGDPGHAEPGDPQRFSLVAMQALALDLDLRELLHAPMYGGFYLMDDARTQTLWSTAEAFAAFLLRSDNVPDTRGPFLAYVRSALHGRRGDSSSLFDDTLGRRIEELHEPFRRWLQQAAVR
jgi:hypothetical protein